MEDIQSITMAFLESLDEGYASDSSLQRRGRKRLLRKRFQLGKVLKLRGIIQSFMTRPTLHIPQMRSSIQAFTSSPKFWDAILSFPPLPIPERVQKLLISISIFLIPSFIHKPASKPEKRGSMAYLDGLRGVAAVIVMVHHYSCQFTPALLEGWGTDISASGISENRWFFQLPFFRVVHSGSFMVVLFFAISGCVLSRSGLRIARSRKRPEFLSSLASSLFRRWLRLHLPVIASMCVALFISRMEWWTHLKPDWLASSSSFPLNETTVPTNLTIQSIAPLTAVKIVEEANSSTVKMLARSAILAERKMRVQWDWRGATKNQSLAFQLTDFWGAVIDVCDPFAGGAIPGIRASGYNAGMILWTIPIEYLGSLVVFVTVLGLAWARTWFRLAMLCCLILWCHYRVKWYIATFLTGTLIAELTLIKEIRAAASNDLPIDDLPLDSGEKYLSSDFLSRLLSPIFPWTNRATTTFWILLWIIGIYIGSAPQIGWVSSPGFVTLRSLIPEWYLAKDLFYPCLGAIFMMLSITYSPTIQSLFLTTTAQYLGRVSFSLYLLHSQILCSLGIRVMSAAMKMIGGGETYFQFAVGMLLGGVIVVPVTFWAADVFTRAVDEKSVVFSRWVADRVLLVD